MRHESIQNPYASELETSSAWSLETEYWCFFKEWVRLCLIREGTRLWRCGFVFTIRVCSILTTKIRCLYHGLQFAKSLGIHKLEVESDSFVGVAMILGHIETSINCREEGTWVSYSRISILWLCNMCIEKGTLLLIFLSHYAYSYHRGVHELEVPLSGLYNRILHDRLSVA